MNGETALKYSRERHNDPDGDFGRARRQQLGDALALWLVRCGWGDEGAVGPAHVGEPTLVRVLSTLLLPDGGSAKVFGHDVERWVVIDGVGSVDEVSARVDAVVRSRLRMG